MAESVRAFIAVPMPEYVVSHLAMLQNEMKSSGFPKLKWVRPENIHLTLKFFGDIPVDSINRIGEVMAAVSKGVAPMTLTAGGLGVFPTIRRPRVIWTGLKGRIHELIEFQKRLDGNLEEIGFPGENRPFKAHLTLARIKHPVSPQLLIKAFDALGGLESRPYSADRLILFKSVLKPGGAEYHPLFEAVLME